MTRSTRKEQISKPDPNTMNDNKHLFDTHIVTSSRGYTPPVPFTGPTIEGRLFHAYTGATLTHEEWSTEMRRRKKSSRPGDIEYDEVVAVGEDIAIGHSLACALAFVEGTLAGAIPYIAIEESNSATGEDPCESVTDTLQHFLGLVSCWPWTLPRLLHEYLAIEEDYDPWIARHIKKRQMKLGQNYLIMSQKEIPEVRGEVLLSFRMAHEISLIETTRRAKQVQTFWRDRQQCQR
jgi:phage anti-repressor protein